MIPPRGSNKGIWRAWAQMTRSGLSDASERVCVELDVFLSRISPRCVLAYKAFGSEVNLEPVVLAHPEYEWLTTRLNPGKRLSLHPFSSASLRNRFGILEPPPAAPELELNAVDVVLVPGLVFDARGGRLGYGAGYYDRLLPRLRPGIPIVGVTREPLIVPELPLEAHDVRMTYLATELGVRQIDPVSDTD